MTIKELSNVAGVTPETVRKTAKSLFPEKFKNGVRTMFDEFQSMEIMRDVTKKNMVSMDDNKLPTQKLELPTQKLEVAEMFQVMMEQNQKFMVAILGEIKNISSNNQPIQIEQKEDYFSLLAYCSLHKIKTNRSENAMHGRALKKMAKEKGLILRHIPDERYGQVNSYPIEILEEYFSE